MVLLQQPAPAAVAQLDGLGRRADEIREQNGGKHAVIGPGSLQTDRLDERPDRIDDSLPISVVRHVRTA